MGGRLVGREEPVALVGTIYEAEYLAVFAYDLFEGLGGEEAGAVTFICGRHETPPNGVGEAGGRCPRRRN